MRLGALSFLMLGGCVHWTHPMKTTEELNANERTCTAAAESAHPRGWFRSRIRSSLGSMGCVPDGGTPGGVICTSTPSTWIPSPPHDGNRSRATRSSSGAWSSGATGRATGGRRPRGCETADGGQAPVPGATVPRAVDAARPREIA